MFYNILFLRELALATVIVAQEGRRSRGDSGLVAVFSIGLASKFNRVNRVNRVE